jgi:hypothetical protein
MSEIPPDIRWFQCFKTVEHDHIDGKHYWHHCTIIAEHTHENDTAFSVHICTGNTPIEEVRPQVRNHFHTVMINIGENVHLKKHMMMWLYVKLIFYQVHLHLIVV